MSREIDCPCCGERISVPAFEGDGVYGRPHVCQQRKAFELAQFPGLSPVDEEDND